MTDKEVKEVIDGVNELLKTRKLKMVYDTGNMGATSPPGPQGISDEGFIKKLDDDLLEQGLSWTAPPGATGPTGISFELVEQYDTICKNCGLTYGSHSAFTPELNLCPGHEGKMDWNNSPGTYFEEDKEKSPQYKECPCGGSLVSVAERYFQECNWCGKRWSYAQIDSLRVTKGTSAKNLKVKGRMLRFERLGV